MRLPERVLPCECCGIEVKLSRRRLLELVKSNRKPFCEQCRRYVMPGTARTSQPLSETEDMAMRLRRKTGNGAKTKRGLASYPAKRCGRGVCETSGRNDQ